MLRVATSFTVVVDAVPCLGIVIALDKCTQFNHSRESAVHHGGSNLGVPELVGTAHRLSSEVFVVVRRHAATLPTAGITQLPSGIPGRATRFKLPEVPFQDPSSVTMGQGDSPTLQSV